MKLVFALVLLVAAGRVAYSVYRHDAAPTPLRRIVPSALQRQETAEDTPPEEVEDVWHPTSWLKVIGEAAEADVQASVRPTTIRARLARRIMSCVRLTTTSSG